MLAIIIPYYKLTFFEDTLESLSSQTSKCFRVYIGDDASLENPMYLLEKYKRKFDFIYHRFETNLGGISLTQQWERCIALSSKEEWLMILGDDDVLGLNMVEEFYRQYEVFRGKTNVVRFASQIINSEGVISRNVFKHPDFERPLDSFLRKLEGGTRSSLSEYVFSKAIYIKHGFTNYPLAWYSDDKAWLDFSENKPVYSINSSLVYVRVSNFSISGSKENLDLKSKASVLFFKDAIKEYFPSFKVAQKIIFLRKFESVIRDYEKSYLKDYTFVFFHYLKMGKLNLFYKSLKRFTKILISYK